jgi:hypothetical protein
MTVQGDIEWIGIGNRKFISREILMEFIKASTPETGQPFAR